MLGFDWQIHGTTFLYPVSRASQMCTIRPPAKKNASMCLAILYHRASCCIRLRIYAHDGFQWKPASMCASILAVGLPRCWASQLHTMWPPAWTRFHAFHSITVGGRTTTSKDGEDLFEAIDPPKLTTLGVDWGIALCEEASPRPCLLRKAH